MKKSFVLSLIFVILISMAIPAIAEGYEFQPRFIALESNTCNLNIKNGTAAVVGEASCINGYTVILTLNLQRYVNNNWTTIKTYTGSKDIYSFVNETENVSRGYNYRVRTVATVYDNDDVVVEAPVLYSNVINY